MLKGACSLAFEFAQAKTDCWGLIFIIQNCYFNHLKQQACQGLAYFKKTNNGVFLENLLSVFQKHKCHPNQIYNVDKTSVKTGYFPDKIIAEKGEKHIVKVFKQNIGY